MVSSGICKWLVLFSVLLALGLTRASGGRSNRGSPKIPEEQIIPECGIFHYTDMFGPPDPEKKERSYRGQWQATPLFPSFVGINAVNHRGKSQGYCGGVLLSDTVVLTVRECLELYKNNLFEAAATHYHPRNWEDYGIQVEKHIKVCAGSSWDKQPFILLVLQNKTSFNMQRRKIETACLAEKPPRESEVYVQVGLGLTTHHDWMLMDDEPDIYQWLHVREQYCEKPHPQDHFCFKAIKGNYQGEPCEGDLGGPIYGLEGERTVVKALVTDFTNKCNSHSQFSGLAVSTIKDKIQDMLSYCDRDENRNGEENRRRHHREH